MSAVLPAEIVTCFWTERKPLKSARTVTRPGGADIWKCPDSSVVAVMFVPSIVTVAPDSGASRSGDRIVPEIVPVSPDAGSGTLSVGVSAGG
jgi:hypothetical protein